MMRSSRHQLEERHTTRTSPKPTTYLHCRTDAPWVLRPVLWLSATLADGLHCSACIFLEVLIVNLLKYLNPWRMFVVRYLLVTFIKCLC